MLKCVEIHLHSTLQLHAWHLIKHINTLPSAINTSDLPLQSYLRHSNSEVPDSTSHSS
jgi:hypothetical protein